MRMHQVVHPLAEELVDAPAQQCASGLVHERGPPFGVEAEDSVGGRIQNLCGIGALGALALAYVHDGADHARWNAGSIVDDIGMTDHVEVDTVTAPKAVFVRPELLSRDDGRHHPAKDSLFVVGVDGVRPYGEVDVAGNGESEVFFQGFVEPAAVGLEVPLEHDVAGGFCGQVESVFAPS